MARDETRSAQAELDRQEPQAGPHPSPDKPPAASEPTLVPQETVDAPETPPDVRVSLAPDSDLGDEVAVTVPGLYSDVEPLPHPDAIKDAEGEYLPGFDESTVTLEKTDDGYARPDKAPQPEPVAPLDDEGRLVLSSSPVEVPAAVADVLRSLPFVKVGAA